jgi:hypothetical protein
MKAHNAAVRCVSFSRDGRQIVTCSDDKSIKVLLFSSIVYNKVNYSYRHGILVACDFSTHYLATSTGCDLLTSPQTCV